MCVCGGSGSYGRQCPASTYSAPRVCRPRDSICFHRGQWLLPSSLVPGRSGCVRVTQRERQGLWAPAVPPGGSSPSCGIWRCVHQSALACQWVEAVPLLLLGVESGSCLATHVCPAGLPPVLLCVSGNPPLPFANWGAPSSLPQPRVPLGYLSAAPSGAARGGWGGDPDGEHPGEAQPAGGDGRGGGAGGGWCTWDSVEKGLGLEGPSAEDARLRGDSRAGAGRGLPLRGPTAAWWGPHGWGYSRHMLNGAFLKSKCRGGARWRCPLHVALLLPLGSQTIGGCRCRSPQRRQFQTRRENHPPQPGALQR